MPVPCAENVLCPLPDACRSERGREAAFFTAVSPSGAQVLNPLSTQLRLVTAQFFLGTARVHLSRPQALQYSVVCGVLCFLNSKSNQEIEDEIQPPDQFDSRRQSWRSRSPCHTRNALR